MKYTKCFAVLTLFSFLFSSLLYVAEAQTKAQKFRPAPPGAKGVRADIWSLSLDEKLNEREFERELKRILHQYGARLLTAKEAYDGPPGEMAKHFSSHSAEIRVSKARARRIAKDKMMVEIFQSRELELINLGSIKKIAWEYKVLHVSAAQTKNIEEILNELGSQGWELVQMSPWPVSSVEGNYLFKRVK